MMLDKIKRFWGLPLSFKIQILEATIVLAATKLLIGLIPLRKIARYLGNLNTKPADYLTPSQLKKSRSVQSALLKSARNIPWNSVCLDQALACLIMLKLRGLPYSLFLGIRKGQERKKLQAHAWIKCGKEIIIGDHETASYIIVATFSSKNVKQPFLQLGG